MLELDLRLSRFTGGTASRCKFADDRIEPFARDYGEFRQSRRPGADADVGSVIE